MKMGQSDSVWKDLSGNGNDCEVHREVFEYPPILEGGRNLFRHPDINGEEEYELPVYKDVGSFKQFTNCLTFDPSETVGEKYTISFWAKSPNGKTRLSIYNSNSNPKYFYIPPTILTNSLSDEWQFFKITIINKEYEGSSTPSMDPKLWRRIEIYASNKTGVLVKKIKIEKGDKATPWTPAPEDLGLEYPDWIQNFYPGLKDKWYENKLHFIDSDSHIQIPEINLNPDNFTIQVDNKIRVFNGDKVITENGDEWGRNLTLNTSLEIIDGKTGTGIGSGPSDNVRTLISFGTHTFEANTDYTLSFDLKIETGVKVISYNYLWGNDGKGNTSIGRINVIDDGEWRRYSLTFSFPEKRTGEIRIATDTRHPETEPNVPYSYRGAKLEKGSIATPWTPAPEDITEINIINRNTPFVENNTIHTLRFYNRALTYEEIMQNYRAAHFLLEPKTFTSTSYYNFYDLNRVEINTLATKDLAEVLRGDINLEDIDFDRDMKSIPFADVLNKVEGNINILGNKLYKPKGWTQPKLDWGYNQPFSYEDANRLERNLLLLYNYAKGNIDNIPHCGMYTCGEEVV